MITIPRFIYTDVITHCLRDAPVEACGVLAAPAGTHEINVRYGAVNAERSPTFYSFDPAEQRVIWGWMDRREQDPVAIYHSHTQPPARIGHRSGCELSPTDLRHARDPKILQMVVDVHRHDTIEIGLWAVHDGHPTPLTWQLVD